MKDFNTKWRRSLAQLAIGAAMASFATVGIATADTDGIINSASVPVAAHLVTCASVGTFTPTAFSFDISWIDPEIRGYFLADRSHGTPFATSSTGNPNGGGDVMMIDISIANSSVNLITSPPTPVAVPPYPAANASDAGVTYITPPATDPFAGIACDANASFGGTTSAGRNEITGPNGLFTVNHSEVWVGDGPSYFQPGQTNSATDYANDKCDSSVRVFDIATRTQTDHINVGGCFRTDEGAFDPVDQIALFANPSEQATLKIGKNNVQQAAFVTLISTKAGHAILKQIYFDGKNGTVVADMGIEQAVYSKDTGLFYLNIPGASSNLAGYVVVIDPRDADHIKVSKVFTLAPVTIGGLQSYCAPTGGALGPDNELLLGCSNSASAASPPTPATAGAPEMVIDIRDGHVIKVITGTSGGCDEVAYNSGDDHFAGACTDATSAGTDDLDISDADPVNFDQAINTNTKGAHSVAVDPVTVSFWQPAASGTGANAGGLCGPTPCVLIYKSTGKDDPSEQQVEASEGNGQGFGFGFGGGNNGGGNNNGFGNH